MKKRLIKKISKKKQSHYEHSAIQLLSKVLMSKLQKTGVVRCASQDYNRKLHRVISGIKSFRKKSKLSLVFRDFIQHVPKTRLCMVSVTHNGFALYPIFVEYAEDMCKKLNEPVWIEEDTGNIIVLGDLIIDHFFSEYMEGRHNLEKDIKYTEKTAFGFYIIQPPGYVINKDWVNLSWS